ncbi:hypothetical protein O3G_MSEX010582 [Manduca sexta]|uniref:Uncharacterized protein n=1 Tax=Manduca sexta TaxID=7130 RepID=A0A921ZHP1_MANSE|nr:hypothetical protein O3G_MSEX010582 [Manduca sexta]
MFTEHRTMVKFVHLNIFIVFSSFPFILADTKQNNSTAVDIDLGLTDGEEFVKKIVRGDKVTPRPEYLIFTAPYRLCEGGCKDNSNFAMAFPLYIGMKGRQSYKSLYPRDFSKVHYMRPNAPFKRKTTKYPFTLCATNKDTEKSMSETDATSTRCPEVVPRNCRKKVTPPARD